MKIPLNVNQDADPTSAAAQDRVLEQHIAAVKSGDWTAKQGLFKEFTSLLTSAAERRSKDPDKQRLYIEAGRSGLVKAAKHHRATNSAHGYRIAAVEFIENAMDRVDKGSILGRLFGRS